MTRVHVGGPFFLAQTESFLDRLRWKFDGLLDPAGHFSRLQVCLQARLSDQRRRRTLREDDQIGCHLIGRGDANASHATALPPEVVHADPGDEHRAGVLGFFRQPCVELRADRGEARPAALGELRGIKRDGEGRVLGEEGEILANHEPLDRAVLRPPRHQIGERPGLATPAKHPLHAGRPTPAIHPARKWHSGFWEGPYAWAIGLLCRATTKRPRSGSKWTISVRPQPVSADASMIRFAPSSVKGSEIPFVKAPRNFRPASELRSPERYRIPFADPPTVCSSCFWMLTMTSARRMRHG